jgi:CRISPR-associated Csx2 family protein
MSRKVFISVLGAGFYGKCKYIVPNTKFVSPETRFVQQAILERIGAKEWSDTDTALILLTEKAKKDNWNETITEREKNTITHEKEEYTGLQKIIKDMNLPFVPKEVRIPDGKNEDEMWTIFQTLFDHLSDEDELYFDLTHSFRHLPMLVLVLTNYAKFLKKVKIKYISYGNYEALDKDTNKAPIVDLLPLSLLQDWTFAAGQYLDSGNVDKLITLSKQSISGVVTDDITSMKNFIDKLETVVNERLTCRGINIIESKNFKELKDFSEKLNNTAIKPLNPILDKIKESFKTFDENENVKNGYASAYWCYQNHLYQQAITILEESMYTDVCINNGLNWKRRKDRDTVSSSFFIVFNNTPENGWKLEEKKDKKKEIEKELLRTLTESEILKKRISIYGKIYDLRNDINHAGMRDNAKDRSEFIEELTEIFEDVKKNILC